MRTARIFAIGSAGLIIAVVLLRSLWSEDTARIVVLSLAAGLMALLLYGFVFPTKREMFAAWLPGQSRADASVVLLNEDVSQQYHQALFFKVHYKNIWIPVLSAGVVFVFIALVLQDRLPLVSPTALYWYAYPGTVCFAVGLKWLRETRILNRSVAVLGSFYANEESYQYEFFDLKGDRHGGYREVSVFNARNKDNVSLVFFDEKDGEYHEPGFDFWFYKFEIVERFHLPLIPKPEEKGRASKAG